MASKAKKTASKARKPRLPAAFGGAAKAKTGAKSGKKSSKERSMTKAQMAAELAAKTGLSKAQVSSVFTALGEVIAAEVRGGRPATIPGLVKITSKHKPAVPAHPGFNNFTKEAIMIKAKPARKVVRVRPLKALKDMV